MPSRSSFGRLNLTRAESLLPTAAAVCLIAGASLAQSISWQAEWPRTDFSKSLVDFSEILSGGPPKDGIPAVDEPAFLPAVQETRLAAREAVITLEVEGEIPRAYPIRYLMWHEIVNDEVGGVPVAVTYCPLCNSGIVFDRRVEDVGTLTFGVSGKLRHSDMVMYDRQTESWWQQAVGEGIIGELAGRTLNALPSWTESWAQFSERNPEGLVMDEPSFPRAYGMNPYRGYDTADRPFLYRGDNPPFGIHPLSRVVKVGNRAWPLDRLRKAGNLSEHGLEFSWVEGQASPLDTQDIAEGRDIGSLRVRDADSGADVVHDLMFAFAFHAFHPEGEWMLES